MERNLEPIGSRLLAEGLIDPAQLAWGLERQRQVGGYLGQHLIAAGFVSSDAFHDALARAWNMKRRDLVAQPPHPALLDEVEVEEAVELGWLACELAEDETVVVASCVRPDAALAEEVLRHFPGMLVEFVACGREDIDAVALDVRRRQLGTPDGPTVVPLVQPMHLAIALAGAVLWLVTAAIVPSEVLAVVLLAAALVFLMGGLTQWSVEYAAAVASGGRRARVVPDDRREEDAQLPLYSVILRVAGGPAGLAELFDNFRDLDYPRDRTDAILLVAEGDRDTLGALRSTDPRGWARVAKVPDLDFLDVVRACDHGLALARGRYVVAYDQDERPAADQLRRAVAVFEADLVARLDGRLDADPLVGLRVAHRTGPQWPTPFDRLTAVDEVMTLDGAWADRPGPVRSPDVTSVHFNTGLLRRHGGFGLLVRGDRPGDGADRPPRIESLESRSVRATDPTATRWLYARADRLARVIRGALRGSKDALLRDVDPPQGEAGRTLVQVGGVAMFLAYPVVLGAGVVLAVRRPAVDDPADLGAAWAGLGIAAVVLGVAVVVGVSRLVRRRGWRSGLGALTLPAHWCLHGLAAWMAVWALVVRRRRPRVSAPADRTPGLPS